MESRKNILTELQEIAPELSIRPIEQPYKAPEGYFLRFPDDIMERIRLELSNPELDTTSEINEISPLLAGLKNSNPYRVPVGFFENLNLPTPGEKTKPAPVVAMPVRKLSPLIRNVRRYAVAASIVALLGLGFYKFGFLHKSINTSDPIGGLAGISDLDMANYLDSDDVHWTSSASSSNALADLTEGDAHDLLSSVSDMELEQYLPITDVKGTVN